MRYFPELYAKAFLEAVRTTPEKNQKELVQRFLEVIRKNGDSPLIEKIFKKISELVVKAGGGKVVVLEFAREIPKDLLIRLKNNFSPKDQVLTLLRPELVAGVRVLIDGEWELDVTLRKKLRKLFNNS